MTGPRIAGQLNQEDIDLQQSQGTMDEIAQDTGGKACKNGNDLTGCVMTALKDSSAYYEMSFYPQKVNWDGRYHKIVVKTSRPGVKLVYRRGYYAFDASSLAKKQPPEDHLHQACADQLPSTTIPLTVQALPAEPIRKFPGRAAIFAFDFSGRTGFHARGRFVQSECQAGGLRIRAEEYDF